MRYPCVGSPSCLRTFENGYVQRAHHLSCHFAQTKLTKDRQREENANRIQYNYNLRGVKPNKFHPTTFTGLDNTQKLQMRDRYPIGNTQTSTYRRFRRPPDPKIVIIQTKSTSMDMSGYYT